MIIPAELQNKFDDNITSFKFIQDRLDETLMNYAKENLFAYTSRIKNINSISEKIECGRFNSWKEIDDFIACTLIIPNLSYEENVLKFLKKAFHPVEIKKRGKTFKSYDVFRFDSTRFIGKLNSLPEEINNSKFEIQIRTAFEHAWSVTTHDLAYKSSNIDWKVLRLAAQLKSSVEQLDMIALSANELTPNIVSSQWPEVDIKIQLLEFFKKAFKSGQIPEEIEPKDFSRVIDNVFQLIKHKMSLFRPKKWKNELKEILNKIESGLKELKTQGFPYSLSLFQIIFGILIKQDVVSDEKLKKTIFFKGSSFDLIFPELKEKPIKEFEI